MMAASTLYILYGSATGNAEGISKDLAAELNDDKSKLPQPFDAVVCKELDLFRKCMKEWKDPPSSSTSEQSQQQKYGVILVSSTTGNGDPPENASRFVRYIKKQAAIKDVTSFQHVAYAVLGLGDTNYDQFCAMGKLIDKKMEDLGATRAKPLACADEATGLEDVVEPWLETVVRDLASACMGHNGKGSMEISPLVDVEVDSAPLEPPVEDAIATTNYETPSVSIDCETTELIETLKKSISPLYILYGSATGNAEQIAKDLTATYEAILKNPDADAFFPSVVCAEMNAFKKLKCFETWQQSLDDPNAKHGLIIVASTTGNGDAPENSERFLRHLKKEAKMAPNGSTGTVVSGPLCNVAFSVLGLGDTNYDQFCNHGKALDKKLQELGGLRVRPVACADEATGLEDVVDSWARNILMEITAVCRGDNVSSPASLISNNAEVASDGPEEEKKMEMGDHDVSVAVSRGVMSARAVLGLKATNPLPTAIDKSCRPKSIMHGHTSVVKYCSLEEAEKLSDVETLDHAEDVDEGESPYSLTHPYVSAIVNARYLTSTSLDAAYEICDVMAATCNEEGFPLSQSKLILERAFPLINSDNTETPELERNGKRVIELTLSIPGDTSWAYQPGDSIGLVVSNPREKVDFVLKMLCDHHGLSPSHMVSVDGSIPMSVEQLIQEKVDLCAVVKSRKALYTLSKIAKDPVEKSILQCISSTTGTGEQLMEELILNQHMSIVDILHDFPSCQSIPLETIVSILPPMSPRYYSVSSSPLDERLSSTVETENLLTIAFSVVDYITPCLKSDDGTELGCRRIHGVATTLLEAFSSPFMISSSSFSSATLIPKLKIFPKPTQDFHLPSDLRKPLILIGPGTGISPFMGFLAQRKVLLESTEGETGSVAVFCGCRYKDHDWLYQTELQEYYEEGTITKLYSAFSRDGTKEYVQDIMKGNSECVSHIKDTVTSNGGFIYICGDGNKMARDVEKTLSEIIGENGEVCIEQMKCEGRFVLDIWT